MQGCMQGVHPWCKHDDVGVFSTDIVEKHGKPEMLVLRENQSVGFLCFRGVYRELRYAILYTHSEYSIHWTT